MSETLSTREAGKVYLVGAGPGDPDLLTVKALRTLHMADFVLHDALVSSAILELIPESTCVINVGKRCGRKAITQEQINRCLVHLATSGNVVVRLKGGDPLIFGRAGEELDALQRAGINVEIVPGITAALAAAAKAQVSLTDRRAAERLLVISGHQGREKADFLEFDGSISPRTTIVVYMPGDYGRVAERLLRAGVAQSTPCLLVSQLSTLHEQSFQTTLEALAWAPTMPAPSILIVGETVARRSAKLRTVHGRYLPMQHEPLLPAQSSGPLDEVVLGP